MLTVSLFIELIRTRPRFIFWLAVSIQALLWTLVPWLFYVAPPGDVADVIAIGHGFPFGGELGPPLAYWAAEIAFHIGGLLGVYALSQLCVIVTLCAVFSLGTLIVGAHHAVLAILLMAGITALGAPTPDFGPAILSMPVWALALLHFYRAAGLGQPAAWYALAIDIGVLGLISYQGLMLAALLPLFALLSGRMATIVRTMHPLIAGVLAVLILFPHLVWVDQVGNAKVPAFAALASREALVGTLTAWGRLAAILALSYAGLLILIVIVTNATRVRRAQSIVIHRPVVDPFARRFVYFFALVPPLLVTLAAALSGQTSPVVLSPALVLSALALVIAAGDNLALHHQRLLATAWALLLLLPPLLAAFAALITPWTGIELRITQPAPAMARYLAENFERRTGRPLTIVGGQTRLASLVAMFAPSRPSIFIDNNVTRTIRRDDIVEKGAVIVWPATDAAGTPPPDIKAQFPDLVPEVPRVFERMIEGRLMPFRIGWAMLRPRTPEGAPAQ
ncbi:MAG: hypothetical protein BroJett024_32500 [Alphaproteobacteria bacterium]|nr:MAG: hypothetical protein BroJett024_32500 [Alphaproteobacteria bacterium]